MRAIETAIPTDQASRYLQQLCKHWSHKLEVSFTPTDRRVAFAGGVCTMQANAETLNLRIEAPEQAEAERLAGVVVNHLQRFAFRQPLDVPGWRAAA